MDDKFLPSEARARHHVASLRGRLGRSLAHIAERASPVIGDRQAERVRLALQGLGSARYIAPALFALNGAAIGAAEEGDRDELERLLRAVSVGGWSRSRREIVDFDPSRFDPLAYELYRAALDVDASTEVRVSAPSPDASLRARTRIGEALELLGRSAPDLAAEVDAVLSEIVLVEEGLSEDKSTFAGGSSFDLWGAIVLNTDAFSSVTDLLVGIVHEVTHLLLFAEAVDGPLVLNDPEETYPSPLRVDPRPMDGIFHATFVTARMHLAVQCLLADARDLGPDRRQRLASEAGRYEQLFWDGHSTIRQSGQLTALGHGLLDSAATYMRSLPH